MVKVYTFPLSLENGSFVNLHVDANSLQLKPLDTLADSTGYLHLNGSFISDTLDVGDTFKAFDALTLSRNLNGGTITISVASSTDGNAWSLFTPIVADTPQAPIGRYLKIKIDITAPLVKHTYMEYDFIKRNEQARLIMNMFIDVIGGLRLLYHHKRDMQQDDVTLFTVGSVHRKKVTRAEWTRIDSLSVG